MTIKGRKENVEEARKRIIAVVEKLVRPLSPPSLRGIELTTLVRRSTK